MCHEIFWFQINYGYSSREIASEPKDENFFYIDSYEWRNIRKQLSDRICAVAGDAANRIGNEMSWKRFSLAFYQVSLCCWGLGKKWQHGAPFVSNSSKDLNKLHHILISCCLRHYLNHWIYFNYKAGLCDYGFKSVIQLARFSEEALCWDENTCWGWTHANGLLHRYSEKHYQFSFKGLKQRGFKKKKTVIMKDIFMAIIIWC